jgi:hypothetical protein
VLSVTSKTIATGRGKGQLLGCEHPSSGGENRWVCEPEGLQQPLFGLLPVSLNLLYLLVPASRYIIVYQRQIYRWKYTDPHTIRHATFQLLQHPTPSHPHRQELEPAICIRSRDQQTKQSLKSQWYALVHMCQLLEH